VANLKRWLIYFCCFFAADFILISASTGAQEKSLSGLFKAAPHLWQTDSLQTSLRPRLDLNGRWQATREKPRARGEVELPGAFAFAGEVEFQRSFRLDSTFINRPLRLAVQGANYATQVKINGELTGSHEGGYTPFMIDLRFERLFIDKENLLSLTVSNLLSPLQTLPPKQRPYGWLNEGGVLREIYLEGLPDIFIENTRLKYNLDRQLATFSLNAEIRFQKKMLPEENTGITAAIEIWNAARSQKLAAGIPTPLAANDKLEQAVMLSCQLKQPSPWSPAAPNLYAMRVTLLRQNKMIDEMWEEIGLRKIEIIGQQLHLNGQPFVVRGVNWLEDYGNRSALLDTTKLHNLLAAVKELGANTIRVVGHAPHPLLPKLCDRAGIFLLEELPLYYLTEAHFRQPRFTDLALLQARETITRDRARPSVLAWGLASHCDLSSPEARNVMLNFCQQARQLDERLIYAVMPSTQISLWEPFVDFLLPDLFEDEKAGALTNTTNSSGKMLLPIVGFWVRDDGGQTTAGQNDNAEQRQAEKFDNLLKKFEAMPKLAGYLVQALSDWPAAMPALVLGPNAGRFLPSSRAANVDTINKNIFIHPAGLISITGQRRMTFQLLQAFNRGDRRQLLIARETPQVYPQEYPIVGLAVLLVMLFYINRDRRLRGNLQRLFVHPHGFYVDVNENRKVPPFLSALLGVAEGCIIALLLSGFCYANRNSIIFDQFLNLLIPDPAWKARIVWLIWHPSWFIATVTASLFATGLAVAVFMRILGFFLGRGLPMIQYFTFVFWTASNLLILGIIAPFFYRLLLYKDFTAPLLFFVSAVLLWFVGRFFRGMRVVYTMSIPRTTIIFGILAGGLVIALALYYQRNEAIFEYARYYWRMFEAGI